MMSTSLLPPRRGRYAARAVLGAATSLSFVGVQRAVSDKLGRGAGLCFAVLLCSQFHLLYYASRFLPNTFLGVRWEPIEPQKTQGTLVQFLRFLGTRPHCIHERVSRVP